MGSGSRSRKIKRDLSGRQGHWPTALVSLRLLGRSTQRRAATGTFRRSLAFRPTGLTSPCTTAGTWTVPRRPLHWATAGKSRGLRVGRELV